MSRRRTRAGDLDSRVWGVRAHAGAFDALVERCRMFAARMPPTAFFSHSTAALLLGIPVPWFREIDVRLHIALPAPRRAPHAHGIRGHRLTLEEHDIIERRGLRVSSPARTWCDLASILGLHALVAAGDHLIHRAHPIVDAAELGERAMTFRGRGRGRLRLAAELLDDAAESPPESALRTILVLAGLPRPRVNHTLVDTETGKDVRPDFVFEELKLAIEYQGDYHRTKEQWRKDMTRRTRLEAQGWYVMEVNADDLRDPAELVARILAVLVRRGWRA